MYAADHLVTSLTLESKLVAFVMADLQTESNIGTTTLALDWISDDQLLCPGHFGRAV
jgi:hypothetical protein